jgi:hypothetical protein
VGPEEVDSSNHSRRRSKAATEDTEELDNAMEQAKGESKVKEEDEERPYINEGEECH